MSEEASSLNPDSPAVQAHIGLLQGVISRMAANSASCKGLCVTLVAAVLVLAADRAAPGKLLVALIPVAIFWWVDAYYLMLERHFRAAQKLFVDDLHAGTLKQSRLYVLNGPDVPRWQPLQLVRNASVLPVYSGLTVAVVSAWAVVCFLK